MDAAVPENTTVDETASGAGVQPANLQIDLILRV